MGSSRSARALIASTTLVATLLGGCFAYNPPAKKWAYVGNSVLILGGGAAIASDLTTQEPPCMGDNCLYRPSLHGALVAGAVLATAGLFGILLNATRDDVKTSR
jgi:hypothetical protein